MVPEGYSCAEQVIWLMVVSYMTCNGSAGAVTLTGAHLSALSEKFWGGHIPGDSRDKPELSEPLSQAMASHQSILLGLCC